MKKIIYIFILLFFSAPAIGFAQKERIEHLPNFDERLIHFGYYLGLNQLSYKVSYNSPLDLSTTPPYNQELAVQIDKSFGFNIGFVVDLRLHKNINLRFEPGLVSNATTLYFKDVYDDSNKGSDDDRKIAGTYMHLPLLFKFNTDRYNNIRPYLIGGASYDYNFSSNEKNKQDNESGQFRTTTHNFMYELGVGMEFYFYFFKFSPSIRYVAAINNQLVKDANPDSPYTGPIDYFGTRGFFINLTFE